MNTAILIGDNYREFCKEPGSQLEHDLQVINLTKNNKDITEHIKPESFSLGAKEKSREGLTQANKCNFDISARRYDSVNLTDMVAEQDKIKIKNIIDDKWKYADLACNDPKIADTPANEVNEACNEAVMTLFTGRVQPFGRKHQNLNHNASIKLYDRLKEGIETKFKENEVLLNWYICNNDATDYSLAHYLAEKIGFNSSEMQFDDAINPVTGEHLEVNYTYLEKGKKVLAEFTELAESVCGKLFCDNENNLIFSNPYNNEDFTDYGFAFDTNILKEVETNEQPAEYEKVLVKYDEFEVESRKVIWQYIESEDSYNETTDKANVLLGAGESTTWIEFNYVTPICINVENTPKTLFEDSNGNSVSLDYQLELSQTGGRVKFTNNNSFNVYIQRFKIYGEPLVKHKDNELSYTELASPDKTFEPEKNKYVQSPLLAGLRAQYKYYMKCKDRTRYKFPTRYVPFLQISDKTSLDSLDVTDDIIIKEFKHSYSKKKGFETNITALDYFSFSFDDSVLDPVKFRSPDFERLATLAETRNKIKAEDQAGNDINGASLEIDGETARLTGKNLILDGDTEILGNFQVTGDTVQLDANTVINGDFTVDGQNIKLTGDTTVEGDFKLQGDLVVQGSLPYDRLNVNCAIVNDVNVSENTSGTIISTPSSENDITTWNVVKFDLTGSSSGSYSVQIYHQVLDVLSGDYIIQLSDDGSDWGNPYRNRLYTTESGTEVTIGSLGQVYFGHRIIPDDFVWFRFLPVSDVDFGTIYMRFKRQSIG